MDETYIAKRLVQLRMERNVSARDMSLSIGQASNYINNIENGKATPSIKGLFYICEYLNITPKEFFDDGIVNPTMLNEIIKELKHLNSNTLELLQKFLHEFRLNNRYK